MTPNQGTGASQELEWQFLQCFGQPTLDEQIQEADLLSVLEFDANGDYLATGDRGGRVVLLEQIVCSKNKREQLESPDERMPRSWSLPFEYQYLTEFQSHKPEFDYLKSVDIDERINVIAWVKTSEQSRMLLSTNDKTVKLWKVFEKKVTDVANFNLPRSDSPSRGPPPLTQIDSVVQLRIPTITHTSTILAARCKNVYASVHTYFINSISVNSDQQVFLSSDDLRINLWHLDHAEKTFVIVDMKPDSMQDLIEVITNASFHPKNCNTLAYASSRGCIYMADMRDAAICEGKAVVFEDSDVQASKSFFSEVIASVSDMRFSQCGGYMLSRDYMHVRLWDIRMNRAPVRRFQAHEHLWSKLCDLYENESIFDKFGCAMSGDGRYAATGTYNNQFRIYNAVSDSFSVLHASRDPLSDANTQGTPADEGLSSSHLSCKLLHLAWHPEKNLVAAAALNSLYMYCARPV